MIPIINQRPSPISCVNVAETHVKRLVIFAHSLNRNLQDFLILEHHDLLRLFECVLFVHACFCESVGSDKKWTFREDDVPALDGAFGENALAHFFGRPDLIGAWTSGFWFTSGKAWGIDHLLFGVWISYDPYGGTIAVMCVR